MRILIVDDEPLVARTLALIFSRNGFETSTVFNADEALIALRLDKPDLVLCDIDMPGRDGISLMQDLARELPDCPVLVLTGFYSSLGRVRDFAEQMKQRVSIVTKPCQPADLLRTAGEMLRAA